MGRFNFNYFVKYYQIKKLPAHQVNNQDEFLYTFEVNFQVETLQMVQPSIDQIEGHNTKPGACTFYGSITSNLTVVILLKSKLFYYRKT